MWSCFKTISGVALKKILVIGHTGKVGSSLCEKILLHKKAKLFTPKHQELDLSNTQSIHDYFNKWGRFDCIINAAGFLQVDLAEQDSLTALETNGLSLYHLANICKKEASLLIHFSTDYVFDGKKKTPYTEEDYKNPLNVYGKSKNIGDRIINTIGEDYFIFRTSWLYSEHGKNFLSMIWNKSHTDETLHIVEDQIGTPTYVDDLANSVVEILNLSFSGEKIPSSTFHLAGPSETSWYTLASFILSEIKKYRPESTLKILPISTKEYCQKNKGIANRPLYSALSSDKIKKYTSPPKSWQENIAQIIQNMEKA